MKQPRSYYWDSSVFIAVLAKDDKFGEETLRAASEILRRVTIGDAVVVSSTILITEVLPSRCTPEQYDQFQATLQSPNLVLRGVDLAVAKKAAELRDRCLKHKEKLKLGTPDALHIATYLLYENDIDQIHSYDPHFPSKFKWLELDGSPVYPYEVQTTLLFPESDTTAIPTELSSPLPENNPSADSVE